MRVRTVLHASTEEGLHQCMQGMTVSRIEDRQLCAVSSIPGA